jgi:hypothetical protein
VAEDDLDQFDDLEDNEGEPGSDDGDAGVDAPPAGDKPGAAESKRVSDLTSKWQKAEARAQKAEKLLAAKAATQGDADKAPEAPAPSDMWVEAQREVYAERLLDRYPRLTEYGLDIEDITGQTPAEMKASVKRHIDRINAIETKARTNLLIEHGLSPEVPGGGTTRGVDVAAMADADFEKLVQRTKAGI